MVAYGLVERAAVRPAVSVSESVTQQWERRPWLPGNGWLPSCLWTVSVLLDGCG